VSAGFTPGPWQCGPSVMGCTSIERGEDLIASVEDQLSIANARLIAASPTMAEYIQHKADEGDAEAAAIMEIVHAHR
jgi:hypothetical protein